MPPKKRGKENEDPDFETGKSRKSGFYNDEDRGVSKVLKKIRGTY